MLLVSGCRHWRVQPDRCFLMTSSILVTTALRTSKSCSEIPCWLAVSRTTASSALSWAAEGAGRARSSASSCFSCRERQRNVQFIIQLICFSQLNPPKNIKNKPSCSSCAASLWCACKLHGRSRCAQSRLCTNSDSLGTQGTAEKNSKKR